MDGEALSIGDDPHAAMMSGSFVQPDTQDASGDRSTELTNASPSPEHGEQAPKERSTFFEKLHSLEPNVQHGPPEQDQYEHLAGNHIDLYRLWTAVQSYGGYAGVIAQKGWAGVGRKVASRQATDISFKLRQMYERRLLKVEQAQGGPMLDGSISTPGSARQSKSRTPTPSPALTAEVKRKLDAAAARVKGKGAKSVNTSNAPASNPPTAKAGAKKRSRSPAPSVGNALTEHSSPRRSTTGESLVGRRIEVWWHEPGDFFAGVVEAFQPASQSYAVAYDDGDREDGINLVKEKWRLLPEDSVNPRSPDAPSKEGLTQEPAKSKKPRHRDDPTALRPAGGEAALSSRPLGVSTPELLPLKRPPYRMVPYSENGGFTYVPPVAVIDAAAYHARYPVPLKPTKAAGRAAQGHTPSQLPSARPAQQAMPAKAKPGARQALPERMRAAAAPPAQQAPGVQTVEVAPPATSNPPYTVKMDAAGFDVFCLMPGFSMQEIRVKAWPDGRLRVSGAPGPQRQDEAELWQIRSIDHTIQLPGPVNARSARALYTLSCQLYVRIDRSADTAGGSKAKAPNGHAGGQNGQG